MKKLFILFILSFLSAGNLFPSDICIVGPMSYESTGKKGEKVTNIVKIANNSNEVREVKIALYDYPVTEGAGSKYPEAGTDPRSNSSWIEIKSSKVSISPRSIYNCECIVNIPKEEDLSGTYNCILMVEPILSKSNHDQEKSTGIQSILRYAIHLVTNIDSTGKYSLKVLNKELIEDGNKRYFALTVENNGTMRFRPNIQADFFKVNGEKQEEIKINPMWLFPGKTRTYQFDVTEYKEGNYQGLIVFDQKDADFFGCKCAFEIKPQSGIKNIKDNGLEKVQQ